MDKKIKENDCRFYCIYKEDPKSRNIQSRPSIYGIRDHCIRECAKQFNDMDIHVYLTG